MFEALQVIACGLYFEAYLDWYQLGWGIRPQDCRMVVENGIFNTFTLELETGED
jgi:hypothetical protein